MMPAVMGNAKSEAGDRTTVRIVVEATGRRGYGRYVRHPRVNVTDLTAPTGLGGRHMGVG